MLFSDDLNTVTNNNHSAILAHVLLSNSSRSGYNRPISSSSYSTNWSISHIPGPPSSYLTSTIFPTTSSLVTTTTTTIVQIEQNKYYPFWILVLVAIFGSITSVLTVLGNILVILAFFLDRQIRQPTNYFILSLSVSDFLIGLLSMPILTIYIYAEQWPLNAIICDIWLSLDYTVCLTSIYTVLFITIDRFCSVKMPAKYRKWRTGRKINIMIAITWAVPALIFFSTTMIYPRLKRLDNLQNGVCDVQWNKNPVFNLCLIIGYFWTTLFVMIVLYIFIYGVASNLERKSRENARKMSSLVGMAGNAMTQIGVGIGGNKSPTKKGSIERQNHSTKKIDSTTGDDFDDEDAQNVLGRNIGHTQNSSNSSEQRRCGGGDDDNSNSFESHSDFDVSHTNEKSNRPSKHSHEKTSRQKNRRGMSVNWGSSSSHATSTITNTNRPNRGHNTQKHANVKFFATSMAHSLYRNPIRLSGLSSTLKTKGSHTSSNKNSHQTATGQSAAISSLATIPSESELQIHRVNAPPPQPRPESLAIMSEELFHERLRARQSPLLSSGGPTKNTEALSVNTQISANFPSTSSFLLDKHCIEDVTYSTSNQTASTNFEKKTPKQITPPPSPEEEQHEEQQQEELHSDTEHNLIQLTKDTTEQEQTPQMQEHQKLIYSPIKTMVNCSADSSDESWRLLNSNSSLDEHIPYIDETDFEDLGYILHRRRVPPLNSNEPIQEETIVYRSPFYIKHRNPSKSSNISLKTTSNENGIDRKIYEIYGNHSDAHRAILESPIFDNVELITYACTNANSTPIHHCSLKNVPREAILKTMSQPTSFGPCSNKTNDSHTTSSIIFVSKAKSTTASPLSSAAQLQQQQRTTSSSIKNADVEKALIDFYRCSQIDDADELIRSNNNEHSESEDLDYSLSNYNEMCEETSSLLRLNEQHSSAFIDDESSMDESSTKTKRSSVHRTQISTKNSNTNSNNNNNSNYLMKMMILSKTRNNFTMDTTSDDRTTTNSFSLNTYSQDFSVDKIFQYDSSTSSYKQACQLSSPSNQQTPQHQWCSSSSTNSLCQDKQIPLLLNTSSPQHFLSAVEKKRNTSSDSDAITTTTTTLTNSTQYGGPDIDSKQRARNSITQDILRASNKLNATTLTDQIDVDKMKINSFETLAHDNDTSDYGSHDDASSSLNNRASSKVTFETINSQISPPSSPKTKDQSVMAQIDPKGRSNSDNPTTTTTAIQEQTLDSNNETKNGRMPVISEGTGTSGSTSAKSSMKELVRNPKSPNRRKSKSQNRARKALRTITFILGAFVVCWTPWHIYSAIHSLCASCKENWVFANPVFHCVYFLCYLNSPINPFCYALANQQFKKTFTRILRLDLRRL